MILAGVGLFTRQFLTQYGGYSHAIAVFAFPIFLAVLCLFGKKFRQRQILIYACTLEFLLLVSGVFHFFYWENPIRAILYKIDVFDIYLTIAASFRPWLFLLSPHKRSRFLKGVYWGAYIGTLLTPINPWCIVMSDLFLAGSMIVFFRNSDKRKKHLGLIIGILGFVALINILGGLNNFFNILYVPGKMDSNEVFHLFTLVGQVFYFIALWFFLPSYQAPSSS